MWHRPLAQELHPQTAGLLHPCCLANSNLVPEKEERKNKRSNDQRAKRREKKRKKREKKREKRGKKKKEKAVS